MQIISEKDWKDFSKHENVQDNYDYYTSQVRSPVGWPKFEFREIESAYVPHSYNKNESIFQVKYRLFKLDEPKYYPHTPTCTPLEIFSNDKALQFYNYADKSIIIFEEKVDESKRGYGDFKVVSVDSENKIEEIIHVKGDGTNTITGMYIPREHEMVFFKKGTVELEFKHDKRRAEQFFDVFKLWDEGKLDEIRKYESSASLILREETDKYKIIEILYPAKYLCMTVYPVGFGGGDYLRIYDISELHNGKIEEIELDCGISNMGTQHVRLKDRIEVRGDSFSVLADQYFSIKDGKAYDPYPSKCSQPLDKTEE